MANHKKRQREGGEVKTNFIAEEAQRITQENHQNRSKNQKHARKRSLRHQAHLNETNKVHSKIKKRDHHSGVFQIY